MLLFMFKCYAVQKNPQSVVDLVDCACAKSFDRCTTPPNTSHLAKPSNKNTAIMNAAVPTTDRSKAHKEIAVITDKHQGLEGMLSSRALSIEERK